MRVKMQMTMLKNMKPSEVDKDYSQITAENPERINELDQLLDKTMEDCYWTSRWWLMSQKEQEMFKLLSREKWREYRKAEANTEEGFIRDMARKKAYEIILVKMLVRNVVKTFNEVLVRNVVMTFNDEVVSTYLCSAE